MLNRIFLVRIYLLNARSRILGGRSEKTDPMWLPGIHSFTTQLSDPVAPLSPQQQRKILTFISTRQQNRRCQNRRSESITAKLF
jgi:hypothetical protein